MKSVFEPLDVNISKDEIMADVREMKAELKAKDRRIAELELALRPMKIWNDHINATGSRRLGDHEFPTIYGAPNMGALRRACAVLGATHPKHGS